MERAYDDAKYGAFSRRPYIDIVIPTLTDPSLAPPGKHVMSCFVQYAPYHLAERRPWDDAQREAFGDAVIDTIAEHAPNIRNLILHRQVLTPLDIERDFGLSEGNIFQGELSLEQLFFLRPVPGWAQYAHADAAALHVRLGHASGRRHHGRARQERRRARAERRVADDRPGGRHRRRRERPRVRHAAGAGRPAGHAGRSGAPRSAAPRSRASWRPDSACPPGAQRRAVACRRRARAAAWASTAWSSPRATPGSPRSTAAGAPSRSGTTRCSAPPRRLRRTQHGRRRRAGPRSWPRARGSAASWRRCSPPRRRRSTRPTPRELWRLLRTARQFRGLGRDDGYRLLRWGPMPVADLVARARRDAVRGGGAGRRRRLRQHDGAVVGRQRPAVPAARRQRRGGRSARRCGRAAVPASSPMRCAAPPNRPVRRW